MIVVVVEGMLLAQRDWYYAEAVAGAFVFFVAVTAGAVWLVTSAFSPPPATQPSDAAFTEMNRIVNEAADETRHD